MFQDSWQTDPDFPPLFANTQDPHGPPQLYRLPMRQIVWKKPDNQDNSNEAVKRLQTELGCYFSGGWHAYVKHHAQGRKMFYHDPLKQNPDFTSRFLSHLMDSQGDIRVALRSARIEVDWFAVKEDGKGKGSGKGHHTEAKGGGKRPAPYDDSRSSRPRRG